MRSLRPLRSLLFLFLALIGLAVPAAAAKRVTVEQLGQILVGARTQPDASFAEKLAELELTERLSRETLSHWQIESLGPASRQAVAILAEESTFLIFPQRSFPPHPLPIFRRNDVCWRRQSTTSARRSRSCQTFSLPE